MRSEDELIDLAEKSARVACRALQEDVRKLPMQEYGLLQVMTIATTLAWVMNDEDTLKDMLKIPQAKVCYDTILAIVDKGPPRRRPKGRRPPM